MRRRRVLRVRDNDSRAGQTRRARAFERVLNYWLTQTPEGKEAWTAARKQATRRVIDAMIFGKGGPNTVPWPQKPTQRPVVRPHPPGRRKQA